MDAFPSPPRGVDSPFFGADSPRGAGASRSFAVIRWLLGDARRAVLAALPPYRSNDVFALTERLRREGLGADQVAAMLTLSRLRAWTVVKLGERTGAIFFTVDGYEQATRLSAEALHAVYFIGTRTGRVIDFDYDIGADLLVFILTGLDIAAVGPDSVTALCVAVNAPKTEVTYVSGLTTEPSSADAIWLDPARRTKGGCRIASLGHWIPPFPCALSSARDFPLAGIKAVPGIVYRVLPPRTLVEWVNEHGQLLKAVVWLGMGTGHATMTDGEQLDFGVETTDELTVLVAPCPLGPPLFESDLVIVRSGGIVRPYRKHGPAPVPEGIAYLTGEAAPSHCVAFEALDIVVPEAKQIKRPPAVHRVGRTEAKKRGMEVDAVVMVKEFPDRGGDISAVLSSPIPGRHRAIVTRRAAVTL